MTNTSKEMKFGLFFLNSIPQTKTDAEELMDGLEQIKAADDLGYEAGLMAYDILVNGKNPGEMPIFHFDTSNLNLYINEKIAGELGITVPDSLK